MEKPYSTHRGITVYRFVQTNAQGEDVVLGFCFHDPVTGMRVKRDSEADLLAELDSLLDEDSVFH